MSFGGLSRTAKGDALLAKAMSSGTIKFTKISVGQGEYAGDIKILTSLVDLIQSNNITEKKVMPDNVAQLKSFFSNKNLSSGFYWREIGVFAEDPDEGEILYSYANAGNTAEFIPPESTGTLLERTIAVNIITSSLTSVNITINDSLVYVQEASVSESPQAGEIPRVSPDGLLAVFPKVYNANLLNYNEIYINIPEITDTTQLKNKVFRIRMDVTSYDYSGYYLYINNFAGIFMDASFCNLGKMNAWSAQDIIEIYFDDAGTHWVANNVSKYNNIQCLNRDIIPKDSGVIDLGSVNFKFDNLYVDTIFGFTGLVLPYAGSTAPYGFLMCDGSAVSRSTYIGLFTLIGTTYGPGNGTTTFNLPDMRGRFPVGKSGETEFLVLNKKGGAKEVTLTEAQMPKHNHNVTYRVGANVGSYYGQPPYTTNAGVASVNTTDITGSGQAHNNLPPYITLNYVIKY